jgi:hypothetical protein
VALYLTSHALSNIVGFTEDKIHSTAPLGFLIKERNIDGCVLDTMEIRFKCYRSLSEKTDSSPCAPRKEPVSLYFACLLLGDNIVTLSPMVPDWSVHKNEPSYRETRHKH